MLGLLAGDPRAVRRDVPESIVAAASAVRLRSLMLHRAGVTLLLLVILPMSACGQTHDDHAPRDGAGGARNRGGAPGLVAGGEAAPSQAGEEAGGAAGSDDGRAHRLALCATICAKDPTGQGSSCGYEDACIDYLCQSPSCTPQQDVFLECLAAVEDSKFEQCWPSGPLDFDIAAYY